MSFFLLVFPFSPFCPQQQLYSQGLLTHLLNILLPYSSLPRNFLPPSSSLCTNICAIFSEACLNEKCACFLYEHDICPLLLSLLPRNLICDKNRRAILASILPQENTNCNENNLIPLTNEEFNFDFTKEQLMDEDNENKISHTLIMQIIWTLYNLCGSLQNYSGKIRNTWNIKENVSIAESWEHYFYTNKIVPISSLIEFSSISPSVLLTQRNRAFRLQQQFKLNAQNKINRDLLLSEHQFTSESTTATVSQICSESASKSALQTKEDANIKKTQESIDPIQQLLTFGGISLLLCGLKSPDNSTILRTLKLLNALFLLCKQYDSIEHRRDYLENNETLQNLETDENESNSVIQRLQNVHPGLQEFFVMGGKELIQNLQHSRDNAVSQLAYKFERKYYPKDHT